MPTLVLLRHGQSRWNAEGRFTGWWDVPLSEVGEREAHSAGRLLRQAGVMPDVVHTSVLTRAIHTAELVLSEVERSWIPVRRHWRLNERHYGDLTGLDKAETRRQYGDEQFMAWRRSYDVPPPPMAVGHDFSVAGDPRYGHLAMGIVPATECLADVVVRLVPYWTDEIAADLLAGRVTLVAAHGNSIRALIKHLDQLSAAEVTGLEIPTGVPIVYDLDESLRPLAAGGRPLGDPAEVAAAVEAVRRQGQ